MAYTSTTALETCIRRKIEDWPVQDALGAALTDAVGTTITVANKQNFAVGKFFTVDQEWFLVSAASGTGAGTITAFRGQKNSTAAVHSNAATIYIEPRWGSDQIQEAISDYTNTLWPEVWTVLTTTITPSTTETLYQLPSDFEDMISLVQKTTATAPVSVVDVPADLSWFTVPTTVFASGKAIKISSFDNTTNDATLTYRARPTTTTIDSNHGHDCVCWGATSYLLGAKMIPRSSPKSKAVPSLSSPTDLLRAGLNAGAMADRAKVRWKSSLKHSMDRPPRAWVRV